MSNPLAGLNPEQLQAATTVDRHATVLSCPGSGKTRVLEAKVSHILQSNPQSFVCCTTFSKEGANEIRTRILASLPQPLRTQVEKPSNRRLLTGTFHALCYRAISDYDRRPPNLVGMGEKKYLMRKAAWEIGIEAKGEVFDDYVSIAESIPTMLPDRVEKLGALQIRFFEVYKQKLYATGKIDFDDLLVRTVQLLESGELQPLPFTHLICDEGQDDDILMLRWLYVHAKAGSWITLLLDDDQCLYSFRNALGIDICLDVEQKLGADRITNATNYRSHAEILGLAADLIEHNQNRVPKELRAFRGPGGKTQFHHLHNQFDTVNLLDQLITPQPGRWFILCRTNSDIRQVATYLIELGIPYQGPEGASLFDMEIVQTYIELIKTLATFQGIGIDMSLKTLGIKDDAIQSLESQCPDGLGSHQLSALNLEPVLANQRPLVQEFFERIDSWRDAMLEGRDSRALRLAGNWLLDRLPESAGAEALDSITRILASKLTGSTKERLAALDFMLTKTDSGDKDATGKVILMTAHSSKGLQRDAVLLWNLRDGCYPTAPRDDDDPERHLEEERRVLYVAMTRAENELHLVYQSTKKTGNGETLYDPSPFLYEMKIEVGEPTKVVAREVNLSDTINY